MAENKKPATSATKSNVLFSKKVIGGVIGIILGVWFANLPVFPGLTVQAMKINEGSCFCTVPHLFYALYSILINFPIHGIARNAH